MKNTQTSDGGEQNLCEVSKKIQDGYERILFWKKNLFMLLTDTAAKKYITEATKLDKFGEQLSLKDIAFKAINIMPSLFLQNPSKAKDHLKALERSIYLWSNGKINELLFEGKTI